MGCQNLDTPIWNRISDWVVYISEDFYWSDVPVLTRGVFTLNAPDMWGR